MTAGTFLGLEPLILARLREHMPADVAVLSAADVSVSLEASLPKPSVRLLYGGHSIKNEGRRPPGWAAIEQTWIVVAAMRNVADIRGGAPSRADVSPLVDTAFLALDGWSTHGYGTLTSVTPPVQSANIDGVAYIPLAFSASFRLKKDCPQEAATC